MRNVIQMENKKNDLQNDEVDYGHAHLTASDICAYREKLEDIIIAPFDHAKAKGVGYNFSLSEMVYSITRQRLVPICREAQETFFYMRPHETILALSYEYLKVSDRIAGSFHSRVRITAQGVGSISTTLDPGWKGMLLFSLNNPTKKKIKIVLSTRVDGAVKPNAIITLVTWRTTSPDSKFSGQTVSDEPLTLHLDNPPMRIDIWSELASKPFRVFRNRDYQRFCHLVESLSPFESTPSSAVNWSSPLKVLLEWVKTAILAQRDEVALRSSLIGIQEFREVPPAMEKRLKTLTVCLKQDNILEVCSTAEYLDALDLAMREIEYQLLCDQVAQIHEQISRQVPRAWYKNIFANLWHLIWENIAVLVATIILLGAALYGKNSGDSEYWTNLVLAFIPLAITIIQELINKKN